MSGEPSFRERVLAAVTSTSETPGQLAGLLRNPVTYIGGAIATFIVSSVFDLFGYIVGSILLVFNYVAGSLNLATVNFVNGQRLILAQLLAFLRAITAIIAGITASAGPAAPLVIALFVAVGLVIAWEVLKRLPGWVWKLYQLIPGT